MKKSKKKNPKKARSMKINKPKSKIEKRHKIITKKMTFAEILSKKPEAQLTLMEHGMHCVGCFMGANETLEQGAFMHGVDPDKLIKEINGAR